MFTIRTLSGKTLEEQLNPPFRKASFEFHAAGVLCVTQFRRAWQTKPQLSPDEQKDKNKLQTALVAIIKATANLPDEEWAKTVILDEDVDTVHSPWRNLVYRHFNHIFADTYRLLLEAGGSTIGTCQLPCEKAFPINFPTSSDSELVMGRTFDTNIFMLPVFIKPGVQIEIETVDEVQNSVFDANSKYEIWWIEGKKPIKLSVKGGTVGVTGLAAVMVIGEFVNTQLPDL